MTDGKTFGPYPEETIAIVVDKQQYFFIEKGKTAIVSNDNIDHLVIIAGRGGREYKIYQCGAKSYPSGIFAMILDREDFLKQKTDFEELNK